nr:hypothetical protein [Tanacetum cinerariifolium]
MILVTKCHKPTSSLRSLDESVDEGSLEKEPRFDDEEADIQRAVEESLKSVHDAPRSSLPPVVIREPNSGKFQPLPEVQGKGKEKVSDEQVARLTDNDMESDKEVPPVVEVEAQDEGQAGPNPENEKTTAETEAESMVSVTIQQDTSAISPMTTPIIDLTSRPDSPNAHQPLQATATETIMTTTTTHPPPPQPQQSTTDFMLLKRIDLPEAYMKEILHQRMWETNSYKAHEDRMMLYEALEKSMNFDHTVELLKDLAEARRKKKKRHDSPKTLPGSPPHQLPPLLPLAAPSSSKTVASAEYTAWMTTDTRLRSYVVSIPEDLHMDDDMAPNEHVHSYDNEDIRNAYIPKLKLRQDWWKPLEEERPATPEPAWSIPSSDLSVPTNNWASALTSTYTPPPENLLLVQTGPAFELVKVFHPNMIHLQYQMEECHKLLTDSLDESIIRHNVSKPLTLGGPPGQFTIQSNFFFNKDLEYLRYGSKGGRPVLSISKMKAAYYLDVGLEQMVPNQMWIEEECKYDIAAIHTSEGDHGATQLNLTKPRWDTTGFEYKHDFTLIDSPRAVTFRDKYGAQMLMRFNEIHTFIDDTLHQIDEALDYRVKEFK